MPIARANLAGLQQKRRMVRMVVKDRLRLVGTVKYQAQQTDTGQAHHTKAKHTELRRNRSEVDESEDDDGGAETHSADAFCPFGLAYQRPLFLSMLTHIGSAGVRCLDWRFRRTVHGNRQRFVIHQRFVQPLVRRESAPKFGD
jgi:hypothetical protein